MDRMQDGAGANDKLDALWANKRPSPLALQPGQWTKMIDDSEAAFKKRLAEGNTPTR